MALQYSLLCLLLCIAYSKSAIRSRDCTVLYSTVQYSQQVKQQVKLEELYLLL